MIKKRKIGAFLILIEEKANPFLITEQEEPFIPSKGWAEMIRRV